MTDEQNSSPAVKRLVEAAEKYFALKAEPYTPERPADVIHREEDEAMVELRVATEALSQYRSRE